MPISLSRINHPGARQPILHALRGAAKYGGPFSGAGIVPKNNGKGKDRNNERNNNPNSATYVPKNWMDSDNTFSSFASHSNENGEYEADGNNHSKSPGNRGSAGGSDGESNSFPSYSRVFAKSAGSKGHNRIRQERRDKRAAENLANGIIVPKKSHHAKNQNDNNQFNRESDDVNAHLNNNSSSSSLKNLLYRAHNGGVCDNRTDSIDMRNNKGKLDERSYLHSNSYENLAIFGNHDYEKKSDGEDSEGSGSGSSGEGDEKDEKRYNNSCNSERNQCGQSSFNNEGVDEVVSLLNHIRK